MCIRDSYNPVNPVAVSSMGYKDTFESTVVANLDFDQKLDFITKGAPCGGTLATVPSTIFSSACCTPSPETSRVIEGFSLLRAILSISVSYTHLQKKQELFEIEPLK